MKLFFVKCNKAVCLSMITVLALMGVKGASYYGLGATTPATGSKDIVCASQIPRGHDEISFGYALVLKTTCSVKSIMLECETLATVEPAGAEIYRAKVKSNGKDGKFKKIGVCKDFILAEHGEGYEYDHWTFNYEDNTVKTGNAYAYKFKVYCKTEGGTYQYQEGYSRIKRGVAAKTVGRYTCKVVQSTAKKLVVKLMGKSKKNGPLKPSLHYHNVELRYKNDDEGEIRRELELVKYSYNGKKWYKYKNYEESFAIKGKQSVYLHFKEHIGHAWQTTHNIKVSNYQYVQMFFWPVSYNLQLKERSPQIRFNLSSGTAAVNNFISYKPHFQEAFVWDEDIFMRNYEEIDYD